MRLYGARWRAHGDHSPRATPRQQSRSFYYVYSRARLTSSRIFAVFARVFALAFRLCFETILVSAGAVLSSLPALCILSLPALSVSLLPAFCSRLWSGLCSLLSLPAFCSRLCRRSVLVSVPLLVHLCLATPLTRRVAFYTSRVILIFILLISKVIFN